jgi:hypothetical protein
MVCDLGTKKPTESRPFYVNGPFFMLNSFGQVHIDTHLEINIPSKLPTEYVTSYRAVTSIIHSIDS